MYYDWEADYCILASCLPVFTHSLHLNFLVVLYDVLPSLALLVLLGVF